MSTPLFAMLGWPEIIGILIIVLVLFGARKVPELMRGLGHGIKEFKKATREVQDDLQQALEDEPPPPARRSPPAQSSEETHTVAQGSSEEKP